MGGGAGKPIVSGQGRFKQRHNHPADCLQTAPSDGSGGGGVDARLPSSERELGRGPAPSIVQEAGGNASPRRGARHGSGAARLGTQAGPSSLGAQAGAQFLQATLRVPTHT